MITPSVMIAPRNLGLRLNRGGRGPWPYVEPGPG